MKIIDVLKGFSSKRILIVGDLILDRFIWGKVERISPEAPVPIVDVVDDSFMLGGAANVANNIVALKGRATVMGVVGSDSAAGVILEMLTERGITPALIEGTRPTTIKTRVIAHGQQVVRFDRETREGLSEKSLAALIKQIKKAAPEHDAVIISDYLKGVISAKLVRETVRAAGEKFVALDPKVGHFHLYKGVSLITPNTLEAQKGSGVEITDKGSLLDAGKKLLTKSGSKAVLITRGEHGMSLFEGTRTTHIPTVAKKVFDVTGAGDTVIAAFTLARAAGASMRDSAVIANHAAGVVVGEVGTATASKEDILKSMSAADGLQKTPKRKG